MHPRKIAPLLFATLLATASLAALAAQAPSAVVGKEVVTPSGLKYTDLKIGEGEVAAAGKIVEVHYVGWLQNGAKFDSNAECDQPYTFRLGAGDALKGWDEGLAGMRVGGKRKLVIPPALGFGKQGVGGVVPPSSVLFYEIELLAVR